jgi:hypothetical protein
MRLRSALAVPTNAISRYFVQQSQLTIHMTMAVFRVVALCSLVEVHRRFRGAFCLHSQGEDGGRKHL